MPTPPISQTGLRMPDDFEYACHEAVHRRIGSLSQSHPAQYQEYAGGWIAVAYRFYACAEHDEAFTQLIQKPRSDAPQEPERYYQERELFGFFITGLSAIESACYGLFAIASMLDEANFPMTEDEDKKKIDPAHTARKLRRVFPDEGISHALSRMMGSQEYKEWKEVRNILAHRVSPGRRIFRTAGASLGGAPIDALWTKGIPLNASTTPQRRAWLARTIGNVLREADAFTGSRF